MFPSREHFGNRIFSNFNYIFRVKFAKNRHLFPCSHVPEILRVCIGEKQKLAKKGFKVVCVHESREHGNK